MIQTRRSRRQFLFSFPLLCLSPVARPQVQHPLDTVPVYLVPLSDFPEELAGALAKSLQQNLDFRVKASLRLPRLPLATVPGTMQVVAEDILIQGAKASSRLPEATASTLRVFLTLQDINSRSANLRFLFSSHNKALNCSVVSLARLLDFTGDRFVLSERSVLRMLKLIKRSIGEMSLGWNRSSDPTDLMYAPLMGVEDLDRLGMDHSETAPQEPQPSTPGPIPNRI